MKGSRLRRLNKIKIEVVPPVVTISNTSPLTVTKGNIPVSNIMPERTQVRPKHIFSKMLNRYLDE